MGNSKVGSGRIALSRAYASAGQSAGRKFGAVVLAMTLWAQPWPAGPVRGEAQGVSFIARKDFAAGSFPESVAVGDFNGDGVPDLAVANSSDQFSPGGISVLLGNGDGTFQAAQHFDAGLNPRSVAVGDFNGDGVADLAVANQGSANVSVLLGNGDGTFQAARSFGAGMSPILVPGSINTITY